MTFLKNVYLECKNITWISKKELFILTLSAILLSVVWSVYMFGIDKMCIAAYTFIVSKFI